MTDALAGSAPREETEDADLLRRFIGSEKVVNIKL